MKPAILLCLVSAVMAYPGSKLKKPTSTDRFLGFMVPGQSKGMSPKIVGGTEAAPHSAPHQVSIQINEDGYWYHNCGGSIVGKDKIVTAAHCVYGADPSDFRVVAGEHDLTTIEGTEQTSSVASLIWHPNYDPATVDFDYAVLRLSDPFTFDSAVNSIALPSSASYVPSGNCVNTGWGNTRGDGGTSNPAKLQEVTVPIVNHDECVNDYNDVNYITENMICAGAPSKGPCKGDSGGPLVCGGILAGIVSWGVEPCAMTGYPGVFSNVAAGKSWLEDQ